MKKISSFVLCALLVSCSFSKNEKNDVSEVSAKEESSVTRQETGFNTELTYPGSKISFKVSVKGDSLVIQPSGLSISNETLYHDITGYTVVNAEMGDLNIDSYPEVFVYLTSDGSGSYGKFIGYSVNNGKSVSQVYLPEISENNEVNKGYMGMMRWPLWKIRFVSVSPSIKTETVMPIRLAEPDRYSISWWMEKPVEY